jgi:hypothetical protein
MKLETPPAEHALSICIIRFRHACDILLYWKKRIRLQAHMGLLILTESDDGQF